MSKTQLTLRGLQSGFTLVRRSVMTGAARLQKGKGVIPSTAYDEGTCGIPPWVIETELKKEQKREEIKLPSHLIRPPCLPGGETGDYQTCVIEDKEGGMYCVPCRLKYKYPSFSENIDFVPPKENVCWWKGTSAECETNQEALNSITKPATCDFGDFGNVKLDL